MSQERLLLSQERPMWRPGGSLSFSNTYRGGTLLWEDEGEGQDRRTGAERRAADRRRGERRIGALGEVARQLMDKFLVEKEAPAQPTTEVVVDQWEAYERGERPGFRQALVVVFGELLRPEAMVREQDRALCEEIVRKWLSNHPKGSDAHGPNARG